MGGTFEDKRIRGLEELSVNTRVYNNEQPYKWKRKQ
jgi:hypothetical protein